MSSESVLPHSVTRNLGDRMYDKRKAAALEIEQLVKDLAAQDQDERVNKIIEVLRVDFTQSTQSNSRKGGLIGLAATAIGLMQKTEQFLPLLVPPVLKCLSDQEGRVRYYACEALYNISKVSRSKVLDYFNDIFDGLCKLAADSAPNVKNGSQLLDRLIKDIVTESESFEVEKFIPLLRQRIRILNPYVRQFLVGWITVLDSVPDIDMLTHLPDFLYGLFTMLSDQSAEIRQQAGAAIAEFLRELRVSPPDDFGPLVKIIVGQCSSKDSHSCLTAIAWLTELLDLGKEQLLPFAADGVGALLSCTSHAQAEIRESALAANQKFMELVSGTEHALDIQRILSTVTLELMSTSIPTRLASLKWISMLLQKMPDEMFANMDVLFPALLKTLSDPSDDVARADLEVLARISLNEQHFTEVVNNLVSLFSTDRKLLEARGSFVIRQLCVLLDSERLYRSFAAILLKGSDDLEFCSLMVQTLNLILLTSTELSELRMVLSNSTTDAKAKDLFCTLYKAWCFNPVSTFSLCLLAQVYDHAWTLVREFARIDVTVGFLVQIDKLVQLLESPVFTLLRLQLLEPMKHPSLVKSLCGVLMLLPQSSAFKALKNRLDTITTLGLLHVVPGTTMNDAPKTGTDNGIAFDELLAQFRVQQEKHSAALANLKKMQALSIAGK